MLLVGAGNDPAWQVYADALRQGLTETGHVEGRNLAIEYRWAEGKYDRLPTLAADLVRQRVTVIVAGANPSAVAAKAATTTIPIVFWVNSDPVSLGLVASFNHPGNNLTGVVTLSGELGPKRLELMRNWSLRRQRLPRSSTRLTRFRDPIESRASGGPYPRPAAPCSGSQQRTRPRYGLCNPNPTAGRRTRD